MRCPLPSWLARTIGTGIAHYEGVALTVGDAETVPPWTSLCHPNDDGSPTENRLRLGLAVGSVTWTAVHLLRPWFVRWFRRVLR
jgi:hypothetical protein